jgi:hypothetical protein
MNRTSTQVLETVPQQIGRYYALRYAGLFNLPIPLRYAFGIGVSQKFLIELSAKED